MLSKLWFRFLIIALIMGTCGIILAILPLKKGTDLAGGVDLLYELDLSNTKDTVDKKDLANRLIAVLKKRIDPNGLKNLTWRVVGDDRIEIQMPLATDKTREARAKFREAENALAASNVQRTALELALGESGAARDEALEKIAPKGSPRRGPIDSLANAYDARAKARADLDAAIKDAAEGKPDVTGDRTVQAKLTSDLYDKLYADLMKTNVDMTIVGDMLSDMEDPTNSGARKKFDDYRARPEFASRKDLFEKLYDAHLGLLANSSGGFDDPDDLKRELRGRGVLEFRIAVLPTDDGGSVVGTIRDAIAKLHDLGPRKTRIPNMQWYEIDTKNGPDLAESGRYVISRYPAPVSPEDKSGKPYILLYTDQTHVLDHSDRFPSWALARAAVGSRGLEPIVYFSFDPQGGAYFAKLTHDNIGRPMAIVLDDKAISAPNINSEIPNGSGEITLGGGDRTPTQIKTEADLLVRMLEAGSLPAALKPDPISEQNISSTLGADNIQKGLWSSAYAIIAVAIFMIVYYSLTGFFANLAVIVNLTMLLAAMAAFQASLTLPGIAGIVLTLGMAVDSNVLINERIREEVHRGASLWMAVRQGYDKVFWTIFDAHITTSLTSIVLIFIDQVGQFTGLGSGGGANEVKGFGVTLLIGLMCSMFTALFVTRTLMVASVKWGILKQIDSTDPLHWINDIITLQFLKGKWPFLKMLTVANVDWMGKKYYFWAFSTIITVLGMCAFFYRGSDKYDTEFNGGTQVTMHLSIQHPGDKLPDLGHVRDMVNKELPKVLAKKESEVRASIGGLKTDAERKAAEDHAASLKAMVGETEQANVLEIGNTHDTFQVVATVSGAQPKNDFVNSLGETFQNFMPHSPALRFKDMDLPDPTKRDISQVAPDFSGAIRQVNKRTLPELVPGFRSPVLELNNTQNFVNGLAIVLDDISPPQSVKSLEARIQAIRKSTSGASYRTFQIVPLVPDNAAPAEADAPATQAGETAWAQRPVSKAVILISDPNLTFNDGQDWLAGVALPEWKIVQEALKNPGSIDGSVASFDAAVADAAKAQAVIAMGISLCLVVIYVWIRFGSIKYGIGAILSLAHDALMAVSGTVLAGLIFQHFKPVAEALLLSDFKINLTMIAAYLTIVGYSVNDTIVIFDRIRENRGRGMAPLTRKLVNDSINQCFGRTIWTTFTVFIVVLILYIWGGEGVRGFSFAMLIGVFTGAYSTLAIASPALLSVREEKRAAAPVTALAKTE